jgi:acetyl esterase/lipase
LDRANLYLAATAAGALNTANAIKPFARRGPLSVHSFAPGWLTSELPLPTLGWQALATAGFAAAGGIRGWRGKLGLALSAASWGGLVYLERAGHRSGDVLEAALVEAFGDGYRARIAESFAAHIDSPVVRREVVIPRIPRHPAIKRVRNLSYGEFGRRNRLDIFHPREVPAKAPVLLQVHGGAWVIGEKHQQGQPLMAHLAARGWVCVAINYRLAPRAPWPAHIVDVKRAIGWIKDHIADYGGDPNFVVVTGGSAGGHLSSLAALTPNDPEFQPGFEDTDTRLQACVPFYGVYDFLNREGASNADMERFMARVVFGTRLADAREAWERASTMTHVHADAPPFFVIHPRNDSLAPVEQARLFVRLLREASAQPVAYAELPHAQHGFDVFSSARVAHTVRAVERFLGVVYGDHLRAAEAESRLATPRENVFQSR